jgi:hypothetical protein
MVRARVRVRVRVAKVTVAFSVCTEITVSTGKPEQPERSAVGHMHASLHECELI